MAQHDYNIANAPGAVFRADVNNALAALVSLSSGLTAPATTFAFMLWADTTTGLLKIRNAANSAWITIGTLASTNLGLLTTSGGSLTGVLELAAWVTVASATTTDLGAQTSNLVAISGTANITGLGTAADGVWRILRATGTWSLAFSANIIGQSGQTTGTLNAIVNELFLAVSRGGGIWNIGTFNVRGASQAAMESATTDILATTPAKQHFHPGHPKNCGRFNGTGTLAIERDYGWSSVADNGTGNYSMNFDTAFNDTTYAATFGSDPGIGAGNSFQAVNWDAVAVGSLTIQCLNNTPAAVDYEVVSAIMVGDFA